jgi:hypothetical protein
MEAWFFVVTDNSGFAEREDLVRNNLLAVTTGVLPISNYYRSRDFGRARILRAPARTARPKTRAYLVVRNNYSSSFVIFPTRAHASPKLWLTAFRLSSPSRASPRRARAHRKRKSANIIWLIFFFCAP